jgi:cytidylate kinase
MAQLMNLSRAEAKALVNRMDLERRQFVYGNFHHDVDDPHGFDLVLNSERFTAAEMAEMVWVAVRSRQLCYLHDAAMSAVAAR